MKILIVDDTSIMRYILRNALKQRCGLNDLNIIDADCGIAGIEAFKEYRPQLVFLDITMPDIDGFAVVQEILKVDPKANVVMCTSSSDEKIVVECIQAGAKDYIKKPLNTERVAIAVQKFTGHDVPGVNILPEIEDETEDETDAAETAPQQDAEEATPGD